MFPAAIPPVGPTTTLGELFGPLAPVAILAALAGLAVLVALVAGEAWVAARRRTQAGMAGSEEPVSLLPTDLRPAA